MMQTLFCFGWFLNYIFVQLSEGFSPELSTSSLITCSEHYNGNSLLDNFSPQVYYTGCPTKQDSLLDNFSAQVYYTGCPTKQDSLLDNFSP